MKNEDIKRIALESGFELKDLPDGSKGLRPYVFEFAQALLAAERRACLAIVRAPHFKPAVRNELARRASLIEDRGAR